MNWNDLNPDYWATRQNVSDAVDDGFFQLNSGQSKPTTSMSNWVTKDEATTWLNLDTSVIPSRTQDDWWLPIRYYKGDFLTVQQKFENLVTPIQLGYDPNSNLIFFADRDNPQSGVWYFSPTTAKDKNDFGMVSGLTYQGGNGYVPNGSMWPTSIIVKDGYAYMQGNYTSGCKVINCLNQTVESTIQYGTNGTYVRGDMQLIGDQIWATDGQFLRVIDTNNKTLSYSLAVTLFPQSTNHQVGIAIKVGNNVWILLTQGTTKSVVEVYPIKSTAYDYDGDLITHFQVDEQNPRDGVTYIDRTPLYDSQKDYVYISSGGDSAIYVYDSTNYNLKATISIPKNPGVSSVIDLYLDEHGGKLYASYSKVDGTDRVAYEIDRDNQTILRSVDDVQYRRMAYVSSTGYTYTADPGNVYSEIHWNTDGKILGLK